MTFCKFVHGKEVQHKHYLHDIFNHLLLGVDFITTDSLVNDGILDQYSRLPILLNDYDKFFELMDCYNEDNILLSIYEKLAKCLNTEVYGHLEEISYYYLNKHLNTCIYGNKKVGEH